jgi:AraC-like DNA-binding protein
VRLSASEDANRRLLRARDTIDRYFAEPLDIPRLAGVALMSPAHFIREFRATFGEPPHRYLQRRRVERAMALLRDTPQSITEIGLAVGFTSPGTFSRTFKAVVGRSPSTYRTSTPPHRALVDAAGVIRCCDCGIEQFRRNDRRDPHLALSHVQRHTSPRSLSSTRTRPSASTWAKSASRSPTTSTWGSCAG